MDEENGRRGEWRRRALIALAIFTVLLLIFHRPLLHGLGHRIAVRSAAKENLKLDFRLEGNVFTNLTVRNLHAVPTGPTIVESLDVDFVRANYSLWDLIRGRRSEVLKNLEVRAVKLVLNPKKADVKPIPPRAGKKVTLPGIFPDRVRLQDVNLVVRDSPNDLVLEHANLELDPRVPGELRLAKLHLPGAQAWKNISGKTSYTNKNLIISKLAVTDKDEIRVLNIDASQLRANTMAVNLDCVLGGGTVSGSLTMRETASSIEAKLRVTAENVDLNALNKYIGTPDETLRGIVPQLNAEGSGLFNVPRSWNGRAAGKIDNFYWDKAAFDHATFEIVTRDGVATLSASEVEFGKGKLDIRGTVALPSSSKELGRDGVSLEINGSALDLANLTAGSEKPLAGSADLNGRIKIDDAKLEATFALAAGSVHFADGAIDKLTANVHATKILPPPDTKQAWFVDLHSVTDLRAENVRSGDYQFDSVEGQLLQDGDRVQFSNMVGRRIRNELTIRGEYMLPEDFREALAQPAQLNVSLDAAELGDFWVADSRWKLTGPLKLTGKIEWKNKIANGHLSIEGTDLRLRELVFHQIGGEISIVNNLVTIKDFSARLNERDFASANGTFSLDPPYQYNGKLAVNIADLSTLEPLVEVSGKKGELAGSLFINWDGNGAAATFKNSGQLKLVLEKGRYGDLKGLQANVDAAYSPEGLDIPTIFVRNDRMDFHAIVQAKGETLEITKVELNQGQAKYAGGYLSIPFIWKNLGTKAPICSPNGKVVANFQSENIDIKKLFEDVGAEPLASGILTVNLVGQGTIADLDARLDVRLRDLRAEQFPKFEPATFNLTAVCQGDQLTITGKLEQSNIQPLELTANLPFDIPRIVRARQLPDDTPVTAKVRLPRSSVNFIRQFVPDLQQLDGEAALDVDVKGTMGQPVFSGSGDITVNVARFNNATLPTLRGFKARLGFARDVLTFDQFGGELAGGKFTLGGRVTFPKLTQANLDVQLKADSVLVARNDALTARADADVKVVGPLTSATVTGSVAMTNSQFLKNLDLIPIGLPGRPAPRAPAARPDFSMRQPPFRDWKFDVTLKTKDPFLIRGNLANGGAVSNLRLTGTGLRPGLEGVVRLENVQATLPFSRLEISSGFLYFDPSDSFNTRLELRGTSLIRDYTIHVYIYGTSLAPEAVFTSEPPLPQEEIISLLATGTTREELTGGNNVLAGRAAMLLVQQLYRKIVKKGEPTKSSSVFDRLDLDIGQVDPRTGQQHATARYKVNDQFVLIGDLGVGGDYRGMLKYLIRFR